MVFFRGVLGPREVPLRSRFNLDSGLKPLRVLFEFSQVSLFGLALGIAMGDKTLSQL